MNLSENFWLITSWMVICLIGVLGIAFTLENRERITICELPGESPASNFTWEVEVVDGKCEYFQLPKEPSCPKGYVSKINEAGCVQEPMFFNTTFSDTRIVISSDISKQNVTCLNNLWQEQESLLCVDNEIIEKLYKELHKGDDVWRFK